MTARRCPNCGGLVGPDVRWCGQCLSPLDGEERARPAREAPTAPSSAAPETPGSAAPSDGDAGAIRAEGESVVWACPTCGSENPLEATACAACGTPFGKLLEEAPPPRRSSPGRLIGLSLLFPGAGHVAGGRVAEGLARAVVFGFAGGTAVTVFVARRGLGLGPFLPLVAVLAVAAAALYGLTAVDAGRLAEGRDQVLTTRILLYAATGLMLLTVAVLVISGLRATAA